MLVHNSDPLPIVLWEIRVQLAFYLLRTLLTVTTTTWPHWFLWDEAGCCCCMAIACLA
jgi:hypothetical protein